MDQRCLSFNVRIVLADTTAKVLPVWTVDGAVATENAVRTLEALKKAAACHRLLAHGAVADARSRGKRPDEVVVKRCRRGETDRHRPDEQSERNDQHDGEANEELLLRVPLRQLVSWTRWQFGLRPSAVQRADALGNWWTLWRRVVWCDKVAW